MIKRATSVFFLFIAGILLLANVVIPHHHHSANICFRHSHCHAERDNGKSNHSDHQHGSNDDCCSLSLAVILPATQYTEVNKIFLNIGSRQNTSDFPAIIPYNNGTDPFLSVYSWEDPPGVCSLFSVYLKSSLGLRAPPVV